jgi:hypothetical protein
MGSSAGRIGLPSAEVVLMGEIDLPLAGQG